MTVFKDVKIRFPGGKPKAFTLSYDDGVEQDRYFIELLEKYGLKCTFNINSGEFAAENTTYPPETIHRRMSKNTCTNVYKKDCCEVAVHSLTHPWLEKLSPSDIVKEVGDDRENLEKQFSVLVNGMAYPYGTYSETVIAVLKLLGIDYARTVRSSYDFSLPSVWHEWHPTCKHTDERLMDLAHSFVNSQVDNQPYLFYVWGHTYEFQRDDNWQVIIDLFEKISRKPDVWYATNGEIYQYVTAFNCLKFAADGSLVFNPTAYKLYFTMHDKEYSVNPGETITT